MADEVRDNPELSRFELVVGNQTAFSEYERSGDTITFLHTDVPQVLEGRGVGSRLIKGALDLARARGLKVASQCPFVTGWLGKHPEYGDLRA